MNNRRKLVSNRLSSVVSLAALQGYCYWLDERAGVERVTITGDGRRVELQQRASQITDLVAVSMPDLKMIRNHTCATSRTECSHFCIAEYSDTETEVCSCPQGQSLLSDKRSCGAIPVCNENQFTCVTPSYKAPDDDIGSNLRQECIPLNWRCDGQIGKNILFGHL